MSDRPLWVYRLSDFLTDELIDDDWAAADDDLLDSITSAVNDLLCAHYGHEVVDDMCRKPEHRFCQWCNHLEAAL